MGDGKTCTEVESSETEDCQKPRKRIVGLRTYGGTRDKWAEYCSRAFQRDGPY